MLSVLLFGAALELLARLDDHFTYGAPITGRYDNEIMYTRDSLGRRGKPNARFRKWTLNEVGFRGPPLQSGRTSIVCFGASETFGLYESEGREYPRELERALNARLGANRFQVVNAAYPGQSAATATMRLPEIVSLVHPRVAVIYATPADYIWLPYLVYTRGAAEPEPESAGFELRVWERVRTLLKSLLPTAVQTTLREREIAAEASQFPVMQKLPEVNIVRYRDDVARLVAAARERGVQPVIVTHANAVGQNPANVDRALLVSWRKFYPMLAEQGFVDMELRMNEALRQLAAEQHVTVIDAARIIPPDPRYFADFVHFTDAGAELMAKTVASGLEPLLRDPPADSSSTFPSTPSSRTTSASTPSSPHQELVAR
ncbi:MAG TPA: SGNH/GDSL hydrolase family protein [Gemmatimonadaceae bacterium]|nr:SGNH/GDSL hydrolase family protein [Gemmatimonadaceae bacterium]